MGLDEFWKFETNPARSEELLYKVCVKPCPACGSGANMVCVVGGQYLRTGAHRSRLRTAGMVSGAEDTEAEVWD